MIYSFQVFCDGKRWTTGIQCSSGCDCDDVDLISKSLMNLQTSCKPRGWWCSCFYWWDLSHWLKFFLFAFLLYFSPLFFSPIWAKHKCSALNSTSPKHFTLHSQPASQAGEIICLIKNNCIEMKVSVYSVFFMPTTCNIFTPLHWGFHQYLQEKKENVEWPGLPFCPCRMGEFGGRRGL